MPNVFRLLLLFTVGSLISSPAFAVPNFLKQYVEKYAETPAGFEDLSKKDKCLICHQGKKKKNRNAYGEALHEFLDKKDKDDTEKILAALETVSSMSSDPDTEGAPTFGELILEGKLPAGTLEELKEEPEN